jgi:Ca2+-transporting ATPase
MRRPPRAPAEPLFSGPVTVWSLLQGIFAFGLVAGIYIMAFRRGMPENEARALAFFSLVTAVAALIFVNRSFSASVLTAISRPNPALKFVLLTVAATLALTQAWPVARDLFRFGPLHADDLALTLGAGTLVLCTLEFLKAAWHRQLRA